MNCILYRALVRKCNQISQNVDTTAHCPITLSPEKLIHFKAGPCPLYEIIVFHFGSIFA